jgi:hypothetical protein
VKSVVGAVECVGSSLDDLAPET